MSRNTGSVASFRSCHGSNCTPRSPFCPLPWPLAAAAAVAVRRRPPRPPRPPSPPPGPSPAPSPTVAAQLETTFRHDHRQPEGVDYADSRFVAVSDRRRGHQRRRPRGPATPLSRRTSHRPPQAPTPSPTSAATSWRSARTRPRRTPRPAAPPPEHRRHHVDDGRAARGRDADARRDRGQPPGRPRRSGHLYSSTDGKSWSALTTIAERRHAQRGRLRQRPLRRRSATTATSRPAATASRGLAGQVVMVGGTPASTCTASPGRARMFVAVGDNGLITTSPTARPGRRRARPRSRARCAPCRRRATARS